MTETMEGKDSLAQIGKQVKKSFKSQHNAMHIMYVEVPLRTLQTALRALDYCCEVE